MLYYICSAFFGLISKLIHILGHYIPEEEIMPVQIPESLIALAAKEEKPLYKLVNELTGRFQISEEELFGQWDSQYRQSDFSSQTTLKIDGFERCGYGTS